MGEDILHAIHGHLADPRELEQVLLSYYGRGRHLNDTEGELVREGETDASLRVVYDARDTIVRLIPGPTFAATDTAALRAIIDKDLLLDSAPQIGCSVLLSRWPLRGWFRYKDRFQIMPVPPPAPTQELGFDANPFQVEVKFTSSPNLTISAVRHDSALTEVERLLSVFTKWPPRRINAVQKHWIRHPQQGNAVLAQEYYSWPDRQHRLDVFSDVSGIPAAGFVPSEKYFNEDPMTFELPYDLVGYLDAYYGLDSSLKERFLRAAYWVSHAGEVASGSAMHMALVQAIEELMPRQSVKACSECGKPKGDGPTAAFREFVDQFGGGLPERDRKDFYSLRSALTHGRALHRWDVDIGSLSPIALKERLSVALLLRTVRVVLINWVLFARSLRSFP